MVMREAIEEGHKLWRKMRNLRVDSWIVIILELHNSSFAKDLESNDALINHPSLYHSSQ